MKIKDKIRQKKAQISKLQNEIRTLEKICTHEDTKVVLCETFSYEFTPKKVCCDCSNLYEKPSPAEVKSIYREELEFIRERIICEEKLEKFYQENPDGYDLSIL